jgi:hypothetical protein
MLELGTLANKSRHHVPSSVLKVKDFIYYYFFFKKKESCCLPIQLNG